MNSPTSQPTQSPPAVETPSYFSNPDLISQLRVSRFNGRILFNFLKTHFDPNTNAIINDDYKRHNLVTVLKAVFTNLQERAVVTELESKKDNKDALCSFLNKLAELVTFHSNYQTTAENVMQFGVSDVLKHINDGALTGAVTALTFGGLLALKSAKFRGAATGIGILAGAGYLAMNAVLGDSQQRIALIRYSNALRTHFDLDQQLPPIIFNSLFLPFITEAGVSRVTFAQIKQFIDSKGRNNYDEIVNKSAILKSIFASMNEPTKQLYFNNLKKIYTKLNTQAVEPDSTTFASRLVLNVKENVISTLAPTTEVKDAITLDPPTTPSTTPPTSELDAAKVTAINPHMPSRFNQLSPTGKQEALAIQAIPSDYSRYFSTAQAAEITPANVTGLENMQHDLMGNGYLLVKVSNRDASALEGIKTYLTNYFKVNDTNFNLSRIETLGFHMRNSDTYVPVVVRGLYKGQQAYHLRPNLSISAFDQRQTVECLNVGTFEYFFNNPTERILLKLAGLNVQTQANLNSHGNVPSENWPNNLGTIDGTLGAVCGALKTQINQLLTPQTPGSQNSVKLFQLLSELLRTSISQADSAKLSKLFRDMTGKSSLSAMTLEVINFNLAINNDKFKEENVREKGFVELFDELKDKDRHLAAVMAYVLRFPDSSRELLPSSVSNNYDSLLAYANRIITRSKALDAMEKFDSGLSMRDRIMLRNFIVSRNLTPKQPGDSVGPGEFVITNQATVTNLTQVTQNVTLPQNYGYKVPSDPGSPLLLFENKGHTQVSLPNPTTPPASVFAVFTSSN